MIFFAIILGVAGFVCAMVCGSFIVENKQEPATSSGLVALSSGLVALIFTGLSWYLFTTIGDEKAQGYTLTIYAGEAE